MRHANKHIDSIKSAVAVVFFFHFNELFEFDGIWRKTVHELLQSGYHVWQCNLHICIKINSVQAKMLDTLTEYGMRNIFTRWKSTIQLSFQIAFQILAVIFNRIEMLKYQIMIICGLFSNIHKYSLYFRLIYLHIYIFFFFRIMYASTFCIFANCLNFNHLNYLWLSNFTLLQFYLDPSVAHISA